MRLARMPSSENRLRATPPVPTISCQLAAWRSAAGSRDVRRPWSEHSTDRTLVAVLIGEQLGGGDRPSPRRILDGQARQFSVRGASAVDRRMADLDERRSLSPTVPPPRDCFRCLGRCRSPARAHTTRRTPTVGAQTRPPPLPGRRQRGRVTTAFGGIFGGTCRARGVGRRREAFQATGGPVRRVWSVSLLKIGSGR